MRRAYNIALDAYWHFLDDDGWAIASHIALSALMAMFPFFIVLTSLASLVFGSGELADRVAKRCCRPGRRRWRSQSNGKSTASLPPRYRGAHARRRARGLFRLERRGKSSDRAQPRL